MKKLLQDAWRAVTGNKSRDSHPYRGTDVDSAPPPAAESAAVDAAFEAALAAHQSGRLPEAQAAYARILEQTPDHAPALHFLGVSHGQTGDLAQAERLIRQSIGLQALPEYFSNLAMVLDRQGRRDEAIVAAREAEKRAPGNAAPCAALGDLLSAAGRQAEAELAYRKALQLQPDDADLWFRLGVALAGLQRNAEAVVAYRKTLSLQPAHADACNNLANLLRGMRCPAEAEAVYKQALILQPESGAIHYNLGQLLGETNRLAEAEAEYRQALAVQPDFALACNALGNLLLKTGRAAEAEEAYRQAVTLKSDFPEAWTNLGLVLATAGQYDAAETAHRQALSLRPDSPVAHYNLANLLVKTKRLAEAEAAYRRGLDLDPDHADACSNLATMLQDGGRLKEAEVLHRRALALKPDAALAHYNFGRLLLETRKLAEAEQVFVRVLELQPDVADAHDGLGTVFRELGRYAEAEIAYRKALALQPDRPGTLVNLGSVLQAAEHYAEAEVTYRQALMLDPGHDLAHYNLALQNLTLKQLPAGWEGYERRWKLQGFNLPRHQFPQLPWHGEPLSGESLLLWQEQGVGDTVLYAGMVPDLVAQGVRVILECEARLVPLFARSFPQVRVVTSSNPPHAATREARWQSPLGSLCRWLRTRTDAFAWRGPYLIPEVSRTEAFRRRYRELGQGPVIGISWRSSNYKVGFQKSLSLTQWAPLLALPGAVFVNLQYGDCADELSQLQRETGVIVHHDATVNPLQDLDGFAAQVAAMDLVISTSNSTVHFAGALGIPVWMLLPRGGGALLWYWFNEGDDSPWYPSLRLYRQDIPGNWSGPLARIAVALRQFVAEFRA